MLAFSYVASVCNVIRIPQTGRLHAERLDHECVCAICEHDATRDCVMNNCRCCDIVHKYYLQTGVDLIMVGWKQ